jgi:uncharacterized C2H2 Zn-finger protein
MEEKKIICENCGELFKNKRSYSNHRQKFIRKGTCKNICVHCGEELNNAVAVSRHNSNYRNYGVCRIKNTYKYINRKIKRVTLSEIENHWT